MNQINLREIYDRLERKAYDNKIVMPKWLYDAMIADGMNISRDDYYVVESEKIKLVTNKVVWSQEKQRFEPT